MCLPLNDELWRHERNFLSGAWAISVWRKAFLLFLFSPLYFFNWIPWMKCPGPLCGCTYYINPFLGKYSALLLHSWNQRSKLVWLFVEVKWMRWPVLFCLCPVGLTADRLVHVGTRIHIQPSSAGWKGRGTRMGWGWRPRSSVLFSEAPILNVFLGNSWGREKKLSVSGHICYHLC